MSSLEVLNRNKERILSTIRFKGPSLPVQIAKSLGITPLFASVLLSELRAEGKIKVSDMRVGSSPLYYLIGQEGQLEGFTKFLNDREKEAFELLKKHLVLKDEEQPPVMRVALRAIKDFAVPVKLNVDGVEKIVWKYFTLTHNDFQEIISNYNVRTKKVDDVKVEKLEQEIVKPKLQIEEEKIEERREKKLTGEFIKDLKSYLDFKTFEIMETYVEKKKEFEAKVRLEAPFGKQEFYLIGKDKKNIGEKDLETAWDKAHKMKLPAILVSSGDLNKKGKEFLREWKNLIKWEKVA